MPTVYTVEFAKSGRAKCKRCKEPIGKGDIRIGSLSSGGDFDVQSWYHPACFNLPRKYSTGADKMTPLDFCTNILEDSSEGEILPAKLEELAEAIGSISSSSSKRGKKSDGGGETLIDKIAAAYKAQDDGEPPKKKQKTDVDQKLVDLYETYHKQNADDLKDILRYNHQVLVGNKSFVLMKVLDGAMHGRLARCTLCGGRLKLQEDCVTVVCGGTFDEDTRMRIDCSFKCPAADAPRWKPWFTEAPTEEEKEQMEKLENEAKGEGDGNADDEDTNKLVAKAEQLEWELKNNESIKKATASLIKIFREFHGNKTVDLPKNESSLRMDVGKIVVANKDKSAGEVTKEIVKKFGFAQDKADKAKKREAAIEGVCQHPKNAGIVMAFQELAELYFKEGNRNAGATYTKATNALKNIEFEITAENALGLGKGKTKVDNIGKSSAEKIKEFMETGTMAKLEEKRADAA